MKKTLDIFEQNDIVSIIPYFSKERFTGYVTFDLKVRCPYPVYQTFLFNDTMVMIEKQGFKMRKI